MNLKQTIAAVKPNNPAMADFLGAITKGIKFTQFDAATNWNQKVGTILNIRVSLTDVNQVSKKLDIPVTTVSNHKVVDVNMESLIGGGMKVKGKINKVRFRETGKKSGSKSPDATSTRKQELTSAAVFKLALKRNSKWQTVSAFRNDKDVEKVIRGANAKDGYPEAYDDPGNDWIEVFWKQHKTILDKLQSSKISEFNREEGLMDVITKAAKGLGVTKKDNWNPADIWGTPKNDAAVIKKIEDAVKGSDGTKTGTQTIQQLNALLRGMYKNKELVGISLKKTSGKEALWEEYNIEQLTLNEVDEYRFNKITIIYNLKATSSSQALDTAVQLRQSGGGAEYNFQITSNDTSKPNQNLKFESKPTGGAKARGGKAEIKQVEKIVEELIKQKKGGGGTFKNKHKNYPSSYGAWTGKPIDGKDMKDYKSYFTAIQSKVTTDCKDADEFAQVIGLIFSGDKPWVAQSKLMQLEFLYYALQIKPEKIYSEFWTDMLFLSIKKGDRFGPFAKLY